jgi:malonyl-CoA O-methyltransferase
MSKLKNFLRLNRSGKTAKQFEKSLTWIHNHQSVEGGIQVSSVNKAMYPEVTGYFIPTLIAWGEKDLALMFGDALLGVQQDDGGFLDSGSTTKCVFDTGQIVRGLFSLFEETKEEKYLDAVTRAINWINSTIDSTGRVSAPDVDVWGGVIPMGILLYALEPALNVSKKLNLSEEKLTLAIKQLLEDKNIEDFTSVSHFHAYVVEALVDLGERDRAKKALLPLITKLNSKNWIEGKPGRKWVCSTAMFQYAVICYKLGMDKEGDKFFLSATKLQNSSGGWFGSYGWVSKVFAPFGRVHSYFGMYFPRTEIPWVIKYFFDALNLRLINNFNNVADTFSDTIDINDGRLKYVLKAVEEREPSTLLDMGCGKGRYLSRISSEFPNIKLYACDLSTKVSEQLSSFANVKQGSLVKTSYEDRTFDFILITEALEHSVNVNAALREVTRVLKPGGSIVIIDKNKGKLGRMKLPDWEQWFDVNELSRKLEGLGIKVEINLNLEYENQSDKLFFGITGRKHG